MLGDRNQKNAIERYVLIMDNKIEYSESGQPIYRYENKEHQWKPPIYGDLVLIKRLEEHIEKYIGKIETVFHELVSDTMHLDVYFIKADEQRRYHTFITSGMSFLPMNTPDGAEKNRFAELMICLPENWPVSEVAFKDEKNYWPVRLLKYIARFPHEYNTWLGFAHTVPNGNPPQPLADDTKLSGLILLPPIMANKEFISVKVDEERTINFYAIIPLYVEEMNYKLKYGYDGLLDKFDENGINELIDLNRKNMCKKSFWPFRK